MLQLLHPLVHLQGARAVAMVQFPLHNTSPATRVGEAGQGEVRGVRCLPAPLTRLCSLGFLIDPTLRPQLRRLLPLHPTPKAPIVTALP